MIFCLKVLLAALTITCSLAAQVDAEHKWTQFRGPGSRGIAEGADLPERWSATDNVRWKTDLPGRGWSSPVVYGDSVFLTAVVNLGESEEPKKGLYFGGNRPQPSESKHQWKVFCLDLNTGGIRWQKQVREAVPETPIHVKSSYASETPVTDGERLFVYFGNVGVFCFDFDGEEIWSRPLEPHKTRHGWGTAASPVLHQDRLYIVNDNDDESYLLALDKNTGEDVWRVTREGEKSNWSTPYIWENDARTEIVTPGTQKVRSYDLDGNELWSLKGMSSITIATPFEANGLLFISSGYVMDRMKPVYAIRPGAVGDITLNDDSSSNEWIAWSSTKIGPYNPSTLVFNNRLFVLYDRGIAAAFKADTGSVLYEKKRLPKGRAFTSSPWAYNGRIFCLNEDGVTFVLKDADEFELLHTNELAEDDMCMATPAVVGDKLLIRTAARLYCIEKQ